MPEVGMDADAVRAFAVRLDAQAQALAAVIGSVDATVGDVSGNWLGRDAAEFVGWWSNKHRPELQRAQASVAGLAQSARNNATAQDVVSGGGQSQHPSPGGGAAIASQPAPQGPGTVSASGHVGGTVGELPPSGGLAAYQATMHVEPTGWDQWGKAPNNCTSWVAFRRSELGLSIPYGNGGAMGHDASLPPTLGAIASYGTGTTSDPGHVMMVEQVYSPDKFRVSEMNYDYHGGFRDSQIWDRQANGTWKSETSGAVQVIKFTP